MGIAIAAERTCVRMEVCDASTGELVMRAVKIPPDVAAQIGTDLLRAAEKVRSSSTRASSARSRSAPSSR